MNSGRCQAGSGGVPIAEVHDGARLHVTFIPEAVIDQVLERKSSVTTMDSRRHSLGWSKRGLDAHPLPEPVMPASQPSPAQRQILVRQVTHVQASWTEQERGDAGAFTLQLILDHGADEYVLRPTAEDTDVLVKLLARSSNATFDVERKVLMFGNLAIE